MPSTVTALAQMADHAATQITSSHVFLHIFLYISADFSCFGKPVFNLISCSVVSSTLCPVRNSMLDIYTLHTCLCWLVPAKLAVYIDSGSSL
jgi:hypothetical protein